MKKPQIVIVGAGFGGVNVAQGLKNLVKKGFIDLTIISKSNSFLFTPLLHEVATGGLDPISVNEPLREIFANSGIKILQLQVERIDIARKVLIMKDFEISYDKLVIATGATTNYFGITGAEDYTLSLKSLKEALLVREKIIDAFEMAVLENDEVRRRNILSFTVIGGGPTGVELVTEIAEFVFSIENKYFKHANQCCAGMVSVNLIHAGHELLSFLPASLREVTHKRLTSLGIKIYLDRAVSFMWENTIGFADGSTMQSGLTVWTAGVMPVVPEFIGITPKNANGRIMVDDTLNMLGSKDIFVLGDSAYSEDSSHQVYLMLAQIAAAEGKCVAQNIIASINGQEMKPFNFKVKGFMVSLGQWNAVAYLYGIAFHGRFAWWLWRTVYLFKFASWEKRLRIAFDWTINLFYARDITKLS